MSQSRSRSLSLAKRGLNFEMLMWLFTRLSGLAMYALILFGIMGALVMGARNQMNFADVMRWGFMPIVTHVGNTDVPELEPWSTPFWKLTASTLLLIAVAHAVHGLVVIADDYIATKHGRNVVRIMSILFMLSMSGIGIYVIWTS
jgi:succinate dehydrogenase hydrophobic anchor subunit